MKKIFACYSVKLRDKLVEEGCTYEIVGLHEVTMKKFYCFPIDSNLKRVLKEWNN